MHGVGEGASDDEVDLEHGLGRERLGCPSVGRSIDSYSGVELLGSKSPDRDSAERREDVALDLAAVAVVGRGGEVDLLAGQPPPGEVGAEGE